MIVITGAAGKTGRALTWALAERGARVRAFVRRPEQVPVALAAGAAEAVVGDVGDPAALDEALRACSAVYHIAPNVHPDEPAIGRAVIAAAERAGVGRFVFHSVLRPQLRAMAHHEAKARVEEALFESGLAVTVLQPGPYQQNTLDAREAIVRIGDYAVPYRVDAPFAAVDLRDVAAAAAVVLCEDGHENAVYELAGPEALTPRQIAAELATVLDRPVTARRIDPLDWHDSARAGGLSGYPLDTLTAMFAFYDRHGLTGNPRALAGLLGRPPTRFADFARRVFGPDDVRYAPGFQHQVLPSERDSLGSN
ncbi:SDR family oxidoreductase [Embleya sp. NBC_00896]|uniref:SDR family oxidoreductase n=1 Tax=Embleya sp. NBC_00896 TaxID=2975961 RepID=UPI00387022E3|nr:NmrA family NAD(P)-binding protein [Embleya sp. NBC_00896]